MSHAPDPSSKIMLSMLHSSVKSFPALIFCYVIIIYNSIAICVTWHEKTVLMYTIGIGRCFIVRGLNMLSPNYIIYQSLM